jgi:hypothetical protein
MTQPAKANRYPRLRRTAAAAALVIGAGALGATVFPEQVPAPTTTAVEQPAPAHSGLTSEQLRQKTIEDGQAHFNWVSKRIGGKILADMLQPKAHVANYDGHNMTNKGYLQSIGNTGTTPELFAQFSDETDTMYVRETGVYVGPNNNRVEFRFEVGEDTASKLREAERTSGQLTNNNFANALAQPDVNIYDVQVDQNANPHTMRVASGNIADGGLFYTPDAINLFDPKDSVAPAQIGAVVNALEIAADDAQLAMHDRIAG